MIHGIAGVDFQCGHTIGFCAFDGKWYPFTPNLVGAFGVGEFIPKGSTFIVENGIAMLECDEPISVQSAPVSRSRLHSDACHF